MRRTKACLCALCFVFGILGNAAAFFINFEDGQNSAAINNIEGVSFKNFSGYNAMYGDSRAGRYNTYSDDQGISYNDANFHHNGNLWLWAGVQADARGVIVDFTNNNGTWFKTGYSSYGAFVMEARLTNGGTVTASGPTNANSAMGYLTINASPGTCIDYVVLRGVIGNTWLVDDMSGDTTGVGSSEPPSPPPPPPPPAPGSDDDGDGMPYAWETANGLNPSAYDAAGDLDGDGLSNLTEYQRGTNPRNGDSDADGMPDGWEVTYGLNPIANDSAGDPDGDGLSNLSEYQRGTNPISSDSDGDGMPDGWEISKGLNPAANDSTGDADGDGVANLTEYQRGTSPVNGDSDADGMPDGWEMAYGLNPLGDDASADLDGDEVTNLDEYRNGTNPTLIPGEFRVGDSGIVSVDWLYDGGMYEGEFGIFRFSGMKAFVSNPTEFIKEAVRRVQCNNSNGHIVFSDSEEGARFSGSLGEKEPADWNLGEYKGVKEFAMTPGDTFATILVPNSTFEALSRNPAGKDPVVRPIFSIVLLNSDYGMHIGQMADVSGLGKAFAYEDMDLPKSDADYNDLILQFSGVSVDAPNIDSLIGKYASEGKRSRKPRDDDGPSVLASADWYDWRTESDLGKEIIAHVKISAIPDDTLWMSLGFDGPADLAVYDPSGQSCDKDGAYIPGAAFKVAESGQQIVSLPTLTAGTYRVVMLGKENGNGILTVRGHQGECDILSQETKEVNLIAHQVLRSLVSVSLENGLNIVITEPKTPAGPDGVPLCYDFDGDGKVDDSDIEKVSSRWNASEGDQDYDVFYDLDGDGYIGILDIMPVVSQCSVP